MRGTGRRGRKCGCSLLVPVCVCLRMLNKLATCLLGWIEKQRKERCMKREGKRNKKRKKLLIVGKACCLAIL